MNLGRCFRGNTTLILPSESEKDNSLIESINKNQVWSEDEVSKISLPKVTFVV